MVREKMKWWANGKERELPTLSEEVSSRKPSKHNIHIYTLSQIIKHRKKIKSVIVLIFKC